MWPTPGSIWNSPLGRASLISRLLSGGRLYAIVFFAVNGFQCLNPGVIVKRKIQKAFDDLIARDHTRMSDEIIANAFCCFCGVLTTDTRQGETHERM